MSHNSRYSFQKSYLAQSSYLATEKADNTTFFVSDYRKNTFGNIAEDYKDVIKTNIESKFYQETEKKQPKRYQFVGHQKSYLDKLITPLKYQSVQSIPSSRQPYSKTQQLPSTTKQRQKYLQLLNKLDQSQQKLVISQKKYGQLWRKYQISCQSIKQLNKSINKIQQKHLIEFIQLKKKFQILQKEKQKDQESIKIKNLEIQNLQHTVTQATNRHKKYEQRILVLEKEIEKGAGQKYDKNYLIQKLQEEIKTGRQEKSKSYERIINTLKKQIQSLHKELQQKSQEIIKIKQTFNSKLIEKTSSRQSNKSYFLNKQSQQQISSSQSYHNELTKFYQQKIKLISDYQQRISTLQQAYQTKIKQLNLSFKTEMQKQLNKYIENKLYVQEKQTQKIVEISKLKETINKLKQDNRELMNKVEGLHGKKVQLEQQVSLFFNSNRSTQKGSLGSSLIAEQQQSSSVKREEYQELLRQLQKIKREFGLINGQLEAKHKELVKSNQDNRNLSTKIINLQKMLKKKDIQDLELTKRSKQGNQHLLNKLSALQQQTTILQRQLLAQRLQSTSLRQQLKQKQILLRREYQLSLQNVKMELTKTITTVKQQKNLQTAQKQKIYLQLRELQRKYELLVSEMLTVDDMMAIATKVHKRNSKFVKR